MSFSRKSPFKPLSLIFLIIIILCLATLIATSIVNIILTKSLNQIEKKLSTVFNHPVSIKGISFLPPNYITLQNVSINERVADKQKQPISIEKIRCAFSLPSFLKKNFIITRIVLQKPGINYAFIQENFEEILAIINSLYQEQDIKMLIKKARLEISQKDNSSRYIRLDSTFTIAPDKHIYGSGLLSSQDFRVKTAGGKSCYIPALESLNYNFQVFFIKDEAIIENLELKSQQFYLKLWGEHKEKILNLNGHVSFRALPEQRATPDNSHPINGLERFLWKRKKENSSAREISGNSIDIYDLSCTIKNDFPAIQIKDLSFTLGNVPFRLKGMLSLSEKPALNLLFYSFPDQKEELRINNPKRFDLELSANKEEDNFNLTAGLKFIRKTPNRQSPEEIEIIAKGIDLFSDADKKMNTNIRAATLSYVSGTTLFNTLFKDFNFLFDFQDAVLKSVKFNSGVYDGFLQGEAMLDLSRIPFRGSLDMKLEQISANKLHGLLSYCAKIFGKVSSRIRFLTHPCLKLTGEVTINEGLLDNIIFFNWVADFFNIPSLNKIGYESLSADFRIDNKSINLEKINLKSKNINFNGYFTLQEDNLVASELSLYLSKELLKTSPNFVRLLKYLDESSSSVNFDFQLSGLFNAMNFKWLESDFKQSLQKLLPAYMEKGLEKEIERIIEAISGR